MCGVARCLLVSKRFPVDGKTEVSNDRVLLAGISLVERYANAAAIVDTPLPRYQAECVHHPHELFNAVE